MKTHLLLFVGIVFTCADLLPGQVSPRPLANVAVTITPAKTTLFAGEMQPFVATVIGIDDQSVNWSVEEESGAITDSGIYTAPKIQGVYHITATSRARPQIKAMATVTVLTYCDPLPRPLRP